VRYGFDQDQQKGTFQENINKIQCLVVKEEGRCQSGLSAHEKCT
jgi:hypothetical protein